MDKIQKKLVEITKRSGFQADPEFPFRIAAITLTGNDIMLEFSGGRKQLVNVSYRGTQYRLTSIVLKRAYVEKIGKYKLLPRVWLRNRETNLVTFSLDKHGRLIGCIEQPSETAEADELLYYLEHLAIECDELQYLLRGMEDS